MKNWRKTVVTTAKVIGVFFVLSLIIFFTFRNFLLHKSIEKISVKIARNYSSTFTVGHASFSGLASIKLGQISLVTANSDTLIQLENIEAGINLWYALIADLRLQHLAIKNGYIQFKRTASGSNLDAFIKGKNSETIESKETVQARNVKINYAQKAYSLISTLLNIMPTQISMHQLNMRIDDKGIKVNILLEELTLNNEQLQSILEVQTDSGNQRWNINGYAAPRDKKADLAFYNLDTGKILIPYVSPRFNLQCGFDSIMLNLSTVELTNGELIIRGFASIRNLMINHPKVAKKDVIIEQARFDYAFIAGADFICLDSSSKVSFNKVSFTPFIGFKSKPDTVFEVHMTIPNMPAQDFITSLPEGLFSHFKGMQTAGNFAYRLDFVYDNNKPHELIFESTLSKEGLQILKYGEANLAKLNGDFVYTPIERGRAQRSISVSNTNPNFTTLEQISPYLQKCVLTTEDPSFFYHRGFIDEAFRQSIIKNIRTRKFSRGASTISMQLVKNVFLTREKTISRKMEEILLVYILENNRISSKHRMLEVYFNIIEWGPNVYGIGEAAQFYFQKTPINLTLNECLFLATIIPRPKGFMWRFEKDGTLKPFADRQFDFLTKLMVRRELLQPSDSTHRAQPIIISGLAKGFIKISLDTLQQDSILIDENGRVSELN